MVMIFYSIMISAKCFPSNFFFFPGYGGFGISTNPYFSPVILAFLQAYGAILSVVNIRGGGEFGRDWHRAGTRENKAGTQFFRCGHEVIFFNSQMYMMIL